jgi:cell wall-associated NlpC family hydrolase
MENNDIIEAARKYLGVSFHWHGRSVDGLDCIGLILVSLKDCGRMPKSLDFHDYGNNPVGIVVANLEKNCKKISPGDVQSGDIIALQTVRENGIQHCGFYTDDRGYATIIHCSVRHGVSENRLDAIGPAFRWIQP